MPHAKTWRQYFSHSHDPQYADVLPPDDREDDDAGEREELRIERDNEKY
jgi:hypothetical protein